MGVSTPPSFMGLLLLKKGLGDLVCLPAGRGTRVPGIQRNDLTRGIMILIKKLDPLNP
jgi:hypothetical protein